MAWVCLCQGIDDTEIRDAINDGASDIDAVGAACGAGVTCHGCHDTIDDLLDEHRTAVVGSRSATVVQFPHRRAS